MIQCTGDDNKKKTNDLGVLFFNDTTRDLQSLFAKKIVAATVKAKQKMMDVEINQSNNDTCNLDKQKGLSKTTSADQGQQLDNIPNSPCNQVNIIQSTSWNGNDCTNNNHSKSDFDWNLLLSEHYFQCYAQLYKTYKSDNFQYAKLCRYDMAHHAANLIAHQPMQSSNKIYVIVANVDLDIKSQEVNRAVGAQNEINDTERKLEHKTGLQLLREWIISIMENSRYPMEDDANQCQKIHSLPTIILLAARNRSQTSSTNDKEKFDNIIKAISDSIGDYAKNLHVPDILFNCDPKDVEKVTKKQRIQCYKMLYDFIIDKLINNSPVLIHKDIPIKWYILADVLHKPANVGSNGGNSASKIKQIREKNISKIMTLKQIRNLAKKLQIYDSDDDLNKILLYLHDIGEIVYCPKVGNGLIITSVKWFLDIWKSIIRCEAGPSVMNAKVRGYFDIAKSTGKMKNVCFQSVMNELKVTEYEKTIILQLMLDYGMIYRLGSIHDRSESMFHYLVPSLLQPCRESIILQAYKVSQHLYIGYKESQAFPIPNAIFYALLAACFQEWKNAHVTYYQLAAKFSFSVDNYNLIIKKSTSYIELYYYYHLKNDQEIIHQVNGLLPEKPFYATIRDRLSTIIINKMPCMKSEPISIFIKCRQCKQLVISDLLRCNDENVISHSCKISSSDDWSNIPLKLLGK